MKAIVDQGAQGEALFTRVPTLPDTATAMPSAPQYVVAHSETGHHHVASAVAASVFTMYAVDDMMRSYLVTDGDIEVEHKRPGAPHETMRLLSGGVETVWEITRQREFTGLGERLVVD